MKQSPVKKQIASLRSQWRASVKTFRSRLKLQLKAANI